MKKQPDITMCPICQKVDINCLDMNCGNCIHEKDCIDWYPTHNQCSCSSIKRFEYYFNKCTELEIENNELMILVKKQRTFIYYDGLEMKDDRY